GGGASRCTTYPSGGVTMRPVGSSRTVSVARTSDGIIQSITAALATEVNFSSGGFGIPRGFHGTETKQGKRAHGARVPRVWQPQCSGQQNQAAACSAASIVAWFTVWP